MANDAWRQENEQVDFPEFLAVGLEGPAKSWDISEEGNLELIILPAIADQATDDHGFPIFHDHRVFNLPVEECDAHFVGGAHAILQSAVDIGEFLKNLQAKGVAFADLRSDPKCDTNILPLDIDRTGQTGSVARRRVYSARDDRDVVADPNLGFLVVRSQDMGRGDDVQVGIFCGGLDHGVIVGSGCAAVRGGDAVRLGLECGLDDASEIACGSAHGCLGRREIELLVAVDRIDGPVDAEVEAIRDVDFDDQCLDQDLGSGDIELLNDRDKGLIGLLARLDDQRVGGGVGAEGDSFGERRDLGPEILDLSSCGSRASWGR